MDNLPTDKRALRAHVRELKKQFTVEALRAQSQPIIDRLLAHPRVASAATVLFYHSLPDEVYTHEAILRLAAMGKRVLLPVVVSDDALELRLYRPNNAFQSGSFGIQEPTGKAFRQVEDIDVALVPGMAFDAQGNRLGRGKGYYDRLLHQLSHTYKIGVCFDFQKQSRVPTEPTDVRMDEVL